MYLPYPNIETDSDMFDQRYTGTGGIGAELVVHLSQIPKPPAHIIFTGRNTASADAVIERCSGRLGSVPSVAAVPSSPEPTPVQAGTSADPHPGIPVGSLPLPAGPGISSSNIGQEGTGSDPMISFIPMDLSSLESVSIASNQILSLLRGQPDSDTQTRIQDQRSAGRGRGRGRGRLDILLANAGIMAHPPGLSPDGYEIQFATNHLGHALLIRKLLPLMLETANSPPPPSSPSPGGEERTSTSDVRIITTSSTGWRLGKIDNFPFEQLSNGDLFEGRTFFAKSLRYGNSKLANVVYARELALRYGDEATAALGSSPGFPSPETAVGGASEPAHASGHTTSQLQTRNGVDSAAGSTIIPSGPSFYTNINGNGYDDINLDSVSPPTKTTPAQRTRKGILSLSLTPGVAGTGLVNDLPLTDKALVYVSQLGKILTPEEGTRNHLWALSSPREAIVPGGYYEPVGKLWSKSWSDQIEKKDPLLGRKMWDWTEEVIGRWL